MDSLAFINHGYYQISLLELSAKAYHVAEQCALELSIVAHCIVCRCALEVSAVDY